MAKKTTIINSIKKWWASIPEDSSVAGEIDKQIIKSAAYKILASAALITATLLATFIGGLDANNPLIALVLLPFAKDIIDILRKIGTDYSAK